MGLQFFEENRLNGYIIMDRLVQLKNCFGCRGSKGVPGKGDKAEEVFLVGRRVGERKGMRLYRSFKLSQIVFLLGSDNAYGSPQNKATGQCFDIYYKIQ